MAEFGESKKILAVASGGGHWIQLQRLIPAAAGQDLAYVTTVSCYRSDVPNTRFYVVEDANMWNKLALFRMAVKIAWIMSKERPDIVISTGAAPGYFAIRLGRLMGAKTIWIDSIANVDELSMSGRKIGKYAHLWLTQWPHLAKSDGPFFAGAVL